MHFYVMKLPDMRFRRNLRIPSHCLFIAAVTQTPTVVSAVQPKQKQQTRVKKAFKCPSLKASEWQTKDFIS